MDDKELIHRLSNRDELAFREIVEKYEKLVFNTCYHILQQSMDAEDIAQEVFVEVFESIHQFRNESRLSTWLYRISINKSLNHLRKVKRQANTIRMDGFSKIEGYGLSMDVEDPTAHNNPATIEYKERSQVLQNAINSLPKNQRIAFTLSKFDELSYQEIAEIMSLSISSVESLIHRAKLNLQKKLVNYYKNE